MSFSVEDNINDDSRHEKELHATTIRNNDARRTPSSIFRAPKRTTINRVARASRDGKRIVHKWLTTHVDENLHELAQQAFHKPRKRHDAKITTWREGGEFLGAFLPTDIPEVNPVTDIRVITTLKYLKDMKKLGLK